MTSSTKRQADAGQAVSPTIAVAVSSAERVGATRRRNRSHKDWCRMACAAGTACAAMLPLAAFAELSNESLIGAGLRYRPAYDGSRAATMEVVPVIRYFGQPWFVRSTQGLLEAGLRAELAPGLHAGAQLAYEPGRKVSESVFLRNHPVTAVSGGASVGLHVEWDQLFGPVPVTLLARVRKNIDSDRGAQADLRLSAGVFHRDPFSAGVFAQGTWADAKSTGSLYGIAPQQSAIAGLPAFQPGSGWLFTGVGLLWSLEVNPKWEVVGSLESRRLSGDAGHSPLVERSTNRYISAGIAYRF